MRPESPYRRPVVRRRPVDVLTALVAWACLMCVGAGVGGALAAVAYNLATGSEAAIAFVVAGLLVCIVGAGGLVVLGGGRRG